MAANSVALKKRVLKLVHPGGIVEMHKKPLTAAEVMKKNPRHLVTRPDVFKFPWIVVRPESTLQPGDIFYIVPYHTIHQLLRRKALKGYIQNQQKSNDSLAGERYQHGSCGQVRSKNKEFELGGQYEDLFQMGSSPYDSSSERVKCVKGRSPHVCEKSERCWLSVHNSGNIKSSKQHCLGLSGELLQRQQCHTSHSKEKSKASYGVNASSGYQEDGCSDPNGKFVEESCTLDSSTEVTLIDHLLKDRSPDSRQKIPSYDHGQHFEEYLRSMDQLGHQCKVLAPVKHRLNVFKEKESSVNNYIQRRTTLYNDRPDNYQEFGSKELSRPEKSLYFRHLMKRQFPNSFWKTERSKPGETNSAKLGSERQNGHQSEGASSKKHYLEEPVKQSIGCNRQLKTESESDEPCRRPIAWPGCFRTVRSPVADSKGWYEHSGEENHFHQQGKSQPSDALRDMVRPHSHSDHARVLAQNRELVNSSSCLQVQEVQDGTKREHLSWTSHQDGDAKVHQVFPCRPPDVKLDRQQESALNLKSCLKKNKNRFHGSKVKFTLPGEDADHLRVEVFVFQDDETP